MKRLGMPISDNTILRQLKRRSTSQESKRIPRIVDIDDWSWRKSWRYGTIIMDLEKREVVDVLENPCMKTSAVQTACRRQHCQPGSVRSVCEGRTRRSTTCEAGFIRLCPMRRLAIRFRGIFEPQKPRSWKAGWMMRGTPARQPAHCGSLTLPGHAGNRRWLLPSVSYTTPRETIVSD